MKPKPLSPRFSLFTLALTILLGAVLRLHKLTYQSLWNDELASLTHAQPANPYLVMTTTVKTDLHPPGYHLAIHYWIRLFGDSEASLRFPSVVAGILAIPAIFFLTRRLFSPKEALLAALFTSVLWAPLYYSQEARAYSLLFLLTILSVHSLINTLSTLKSSRRLPPPSTTSFILSITLASYLHYYGFFLFTLLTVASILYLTRTPKLLPRFSLIPLTFATLHLPWLDIAAYQFTHNAYKISWIQPPPLSIFKDFLKFLFNQSLKLSLIPATLILFLITKLLLKLNSPTKTQNFHQLLFLPESLLMLWLTLPITLAFIISHTLTPSMALRNLIISAPAAYILLARAITSLPFPPARQLLLGASLTSLFLYHLLFRQHYYSRLTKTEYRHVTAYVARHYLQYQHPLVIGYAWNAEHFNYYFRYHSTPITLDLLAGQTADLPRVQNLIQTQKPDAIFLLRGHRQPDEQFLNYFHQNFRLIHHQAYGAADAWFFKPQK